MVPSENLLFHTENEGGATICLKEDQNILMTSLHLLISYDHQNMTANSTTEHQNWLLGSKSLAQLGPLLQTNFYLASLFNTSQFFIEALNNQICLSRQHQWETLLNLFSPVALAQYISGDPFAIGYEKYGKYYWKPLNKNITSIKFSQIHMDKLCNITLSLDEVVLKVEPISGFRFLSL